MVYIGALAAPMFFVATLFASAAAGIDDVVNAIDIPGLGDTINLGPFDFITDALDAAIDILTDFIRAVLYFILIILFDQFANGVKAQFIGSVTSIVFLVSLFAKLSLLPPPYFTIKKLPMHTYQQLAS